MTAQGVAASVLLESAGPNLLRAGDCQLPHLVETRDLAEQPEMIPQPQKVAIERHLRQRFGCVHEQLGDITVQGDRLGEILNHLGRVVPVPAG